MTRHQAMSEFAENRVDAWEAMSELFTGKDLQPYDFQHIADVLKQSGYPLQELENMLANEVTPVFGRNLAPLSVPEMEGWSREAVKQAIAEHLAAQRGIIQRLISRSGRQAAQPALVISRWDKVKALLGKASQ